MAWTLTRIYFSHKPWWCPSLSIPLSHGLSLWPNRGKFTHTYIYNNVETTRFSAVPKMTRFMTRDILQPKYYTPRRQPILFILFLQLPTPSFSRLRLFNIILVFVPLDIIFKSRDDFYLLASIQDLYPREKCSVLNSFYFFLPPPPLHLLFRVFYSENI